MSLQSIKISQATPLNKEEIGTGSSILIPVYDGTPTPRNVSIEVLCRVFAESSDLVRMDYLQENYYTKEEIQEVIKVTPEELVEMRETIEILNGDEETEGSVKYQINEAKKDLIGEESDSSSNNTINAAKNLVAESLQFIKYYG